MNKKQARIEEKIRITPLVVIIGIVVFITATPMVAQDFEKGLEAYDAGDYVTALNEFQPLAEQGDIAAQNILGIMYFKGKGVSINPMPWEVRVISSEIDLGVNSDNDLYS